VIELKEFVRETGGGNSGEIFGYFGGGTESPAGLTSTVGATTSLDIERGLPGWFRGTGEGILWTWGIYDDIVAWEDVGSEPKYSNRASGRGLGGGRGGSDGCKGWTGGGGAFRMFERCGLGDGGLTAGCLGGGGARVLFLSSDMGDGAQERS
jgi:hypothetical protein